MEGKQMQATRADIRSNIGFALHKYRMPIFVCWALQPLITVATPAFCSCMAHMQVTMITMADLPPMNLLKMSDSDKNSFLISRLQPLIMLLKMTTAAGRFYKLSG